MAYARVSRRTLLAAAPLIVLLASCVADPVAPPSTRVDVDSLHGVLVVNEGLRFLDNSTLTYHDPATGRTEQDFFARQNPGMRLGDTGNDIVIREGRAYVVVSTSQNIEVLDLPSGRSVGRIRIGAGDPRKLEIVDDTTGYVTLVNGDAIVRVNPSTLTTGARTIVGPAPEGIAALGGRLFVANSGYGVLRHGEPKANTISVLDVSTGLERGLLFPGPNPVAVEADSARGLVFVLYGMGDDPDSIGGVVAYDAVSLEETRRWEVRGVGVAGEMAVDAARGRIYVIDGGGDLARIDVDSEAPARRFVTVPPPTRLGYYGVGVSPVDGSIYASAVSSFSLPGFVVVIAPDGQMRGRFDAGLNPSSFGFLAGD